VQVNGKLRDRVELSKGLSKEAVQKAVLSSEKVQALLQGKEVKQFIYVPERLANIVV
jgi:leucyl-tRNA synthetase